MTSRRAQAIERGAGGAPLRAQPKLSWASAAQKRRVAHGLDLVEDRLTAVAAEYPGELGDACRATLSAGGKRVRPLLTLLCAQSGRLADEPVLRAAAAVELLHMATLVHDDVLALPFADDRFAAVTVGWGVRNVPDVPGAFREMARVTRPGGRVVCLESTQAPDGAGKRFHDIWMGRVVPLLGRLVTGDPSAYAYLPASVAAFPRADELAAIMAAAGLVGVRYRRLGFGAVALHVGEVPG